MDHHTMERGADSAVALLSWVGHFKTLRCTDPKVDGAPGSFKMFNAIYDTKRLFYLLVSFYPALLGVGWEELLPQQTGKA